MLAYFWHKKKNSDNFLENSIQCSPWRKKNFFKEDSVFLKIKKMNINESQFK
jgi:hypothetical protein